MKNLRVSLSLVSFLFALAFTHTSHSQGRLPRFERAPCPDVPIKVPPEIKPECGYLVVAQDRANQDGRSFRLAVAIVRVVPTSAEAPVVMLHGGPSGPGGILGPESLRALEWAARLKRDFIVYDQRGAGSSEPSLCPEVYTAPEKYLQATTDKEREEAGMSQARACVASLKKNGIDPDMFGSEINAQDLADLRKVLGVSKWDVFGVSYGGRLAQEAVRYDPSGVRSVVVHSPSIISAGAESDMPLTRQRLAEQVFAACRAQPECSSAFPTFEKDFYAVYEELNRKPIDVTIDDARGPIKIRLDGFRFLKTVTNPSNVRVDKLPLLIKELHEGDRNKAALFMLNRRVGTGVGNNALTELVGCYDGYGPAYAKRVEDVTKQVRPEFRIFRNNLEQCPTYHSRFASGSSHKLVQSDIPALVLTAEFDDRTPTEHGRRIASGFKNSYHFELPGVVHGRGIADGCGESIILQFLQNPRKRPDSSCLASMPRLKFELTTLELPTLFFDIASADGKPTAFTGTWGAVYPAIDFNVRFQIKVDGSKLTGSYVPRGTHAFDIYDGTISGDTLSFAIKSPEGDRTISFTGKLTGDEISFRREVVIRPGGRPGGAFIWGSGGPKSFTAMRQL